MEIDKNKIIKLMISGLKKTDGCGCDMFMKGVQKKYNLDDETFIELQSEALKQYNALNESRLPDDPDVDPEFGIPEEKKFPLFDEDHVRSAIKFFNYADAKYKKELANRIESKMKKYNISSDIVGENNSLKNYLNESLDVDIFNNELDILSKRLDNLLEEYKFYTKNTSNNTLYENESRDIMSNLNENELQDYNTILKEAEEISNQINYLRENNELNEASLTALLSKAKELYSKYNALDQKKKNAINSAIQRASDNINTAAYRMKQKAENKKQDDLEKKWKEEIEKKKDKVLKELKEKEKKDEDKVEDHKKDEKPESKKVEDHKKDEKPKSTKVEDHKKENEKSSDKKQDEKQTEENKESKPDKVEDSKIEKEEELKQDKEVIKESIKMGCNMKDKITKSNKQELSEAPVWVTDSNGAEHEFLDAKGRSIDDRDTYEAYKKFGYAGKVRNKDGSTDPAVYSLSGKVSKVKNSTNYVKEKFIPGKNAKTPKIDKEDYAEVKKEKTEKDWKRVNPSTGETEIKTDAGNWEPMDDSVNYTDYLKKLNTLTENTSLRLVYLNHLKQYKSLTESVLDPINKERCPEVFKGNTMIPSTRTFILNIINEFQKNADVKFDVRNIYMIGSSTGYQYNINSDIDIEVETTLTNETFRKIFKIIPKGTKLPGTEKPINIFILKADENYDFDKAENVYDLMANKFLKQSEKNHNKMPYQYIKDLSMFFMNGCELSLNKFDRDVQEMEEYRRLDPDTMEISENEKHDAIARKLIDLKNDTDALWMAHHVIFAFEKEGYENMPFKVNIEMKNTDDPRYSVNNLVYKMIDKFGYLERLLDAAKKGQKLIKEIEKEYGN